MIDYRDIRISKIANSAISMCQYIDSPDPALNLIPEVSRGRRDVGSVTFRHHVVSNDTRCSSFTGGNAME